MSHISHLFETLHKSCFQPLQESCCHLIDGVKKVMQVAFKRLEALIQYLFPQNHHQSPSSSNKRERTLSPDRTHSSVSPSSQIIQIPSSLINHADESSHSEQKKAQGRPLSSLTSSESGPSSPLRKEDSVIASLVSVKNNNEMYKELVNSLQEQLDDISLPLQEFLNTSETFSKLFREKGDEKAFRALDITRHTIQAHYRTIRSQFTAETEKNLRWCHGWPNLPGKKSRENLIEMVSQTLTLITKNDLATLYWPTILKQIIHQNTSDPQILKTFKEVYEALQKLSKCLASSKYREDDCLPKLFKDFEIFLEEHPPKFAEILV